MTNEEKYSGNGVIERGYEIYDEWNHNKSTSADVVKFVECAIAAVHKKGTKRANAEALACLFALDMRIKEKYGKLFQFLLSYFSWRRETRALKRLKKTFHISESAEDVRTAIEIALREARERLEDAEAEEGDDETHGGKRNGQAEGEEATAEQQAQEAEKEAPDQNQNPEEAAEEVAEESVEEREQQTAQETQAPEAEEPISEAEDAARETEEVTETATEKEFAEQVQDTEQKVENNAPYEASEARTDKKETTSTYNDAVDSPPLVDDTASKDGEKKVSFIDEMIIDYMVKGPKDQIGYYNPLGEIGEVNETSRTDGAHAENGAESRETGKDDYLYDAQILADREALASQAENATEAKTPETKTTEQRSAETTTAQTQKEEMRVPLQMDMTPDAENQMRRELNSMMTKEQIIAIRDGQEAAMREQLDIASAVFESNAPVERIGKQAPAKVTPPTNVPNRK